MGDGDSWQLLAWVKYGSVSIVMSAARTDTKRPSAVAAVRLGERLRQLRVAAGLTQSELAGNRFSKEYVSQIERGKTRPTPETLEWLARRLKVDVGFLANGVSTEQRHRVEAALTRAEALADASDLEEALAAFAELRARRSRAPARPSWRCDGLQRVARSRLGGSDSRDAGAAGAGPHPSLRARKFCDLDRAEVLWRMGASRYLLRARRARSGC